MLASRVVLLVVVAGALAAALGCGPRAAAPAAGPVRALRVESVDGGELDLGDLRGRVVVLHLFDTGVTASIGDTEELGALQAREPRRVAVVGVALDQSPRVVAPWKRALGLRYVVTLAGPGLRAADGPLGEIRVVPTTILLDGNGRERQRIERPLRPGELADAVAPLLAE